MIGVPYLASEFIRMLKVRRHSSAFQIENNLQLRYSMWEFMYESLVVQLPSKSHTNEIKYRVAKVRILLF